jgi:hypothetical protein
MFIRRRPAEDCGIGCLPGRARQARSREADVAQDEQTKYAPRRRAEAVAWVTALLVPALVGWVFTSATADRDRTSQPERAGVVVSVAAAPR